ncbi:S8 family serine peptidase [Nonomuraea sp. NPDC049758]|uniref:S8 family peptidase n=1 Tax=Nonomuraea sp. NPDC049758 TaxID=3154360 RepID=UPI0034372FC7
MADQFIVLRDLSRTRMAAPFERAAAVAETPSEPHVEVTGLGKREVADLARDPSVAAVARPMPTTVPGAPEDAEAPPPAAEAGAQVTWGVRALGADASTRTGAGTVVAVLDTGIDATHPAFTGMTLVEEDFTGSGRGDKVGHGTHCAGTVFGRPVDGMRIGVAPGVERALIGKVLGDDGKGSTAATVKGLLWALGNDADVITMSLGIDFPAAMRQLEERGLPQFLATSIALESYRATLRLYDSLMRMIAARAAFGAGTIVVAATGNASHRELRPDFEVGPELPSAAEGMMAVGAVQRLPSGRLAVARFSNTFPQVSAPGVDVVSARTGGGLTSKSGTSMAAPHVAGAAALWWQELRAASDGARAAAVTGRLLLTAATDVFVPDADVADLGAGLVQAPR